MGIPLLDGGMKTTKMPVYVSIGFYGLNGMTGLGHLWLRDHVQI